MMEEEMDMQMEMDPYGQEMMDGMEDMMEEEYEDQEEANFDNMSTMIEKQEDAGKDQLAQAREAQYISKGTYIG